jgi:hypothetical protein
LEKRAAWGESEEKIEITREKTAIGRIILEGIMEGGEGTFSWNINYPGNVVTATMTIENWPPDETPERILYFTGGTPTIGKKGSLALDAGLYRIIISMVRSNSYSFEYRETVHVYTNMESLFEHNFEENQFTYIIVTNGKDDGSLGSLRKAIADAKPDSSIIIDRSKAATIELKKRLEIKKNLVIEGGGAAIRRDASWTEKEKTPQLLYIDGKSNVTIRRVMFKDNNIYAEGAAVYNKATLALESCIFSGNSNNNKDTSSCVYHGGAVYSDKGSTLSVKGCTFYGNTAGGNGSAAAVYADAGLTLVGNLFYGNFQNYGTPVYRIGSGAVSGSYNVDDVPISSQDFKPSSGAANVIISRPEDYPLYDFNGEEIPDTNAAAGAVQI